MNEIEEWVDIHGYEPYQVSNRGEIRKTLPELKYIHTRPLPDGSMGVKLYAHGRSNQFLVRRLVAEAFCERKTFQDDSVLHLDGDKRNCNADNLAWRPRWFVWKWTNQFASVDDVKWYRPVMNTTTFVQFETVIEAGLHDATLWEEIVKSAMTGSYAYPGMQYEFVSIKEFYGPQMNWA